MICLFCGRHASLDKAIERIFKKLDQNRSGQLSLMEFMDGVRELGLLTYNFEVHGRKRRFATNSLFFLGSKNPLRYYLVWIVEWKWFDRFILLCIVANSMILAFRDYEDPGSLPDANGDYHQNLRNRIVEESETIFSWIFFAECAMKIMAMGFAFGRGAYLRSYWNQLDFFVVVVGFIGDLPGVPKVSALRTARVLRPLRTLSNLRGMRILIYALFSALPALFNVMVIIGFVFTVFGILGVLIWNGALHYRCRETPEPINGTWPLAGEGRLCGGGYNCAAGEYCGSVYSLPPNATIDLDNLPSTEYWDYKFLGFDNIGYAVLTLFQCITLEGWTVVMYNVSADREPNYYRGIFGLTIICHCQCCSSKTRTIGHSPPSTSWCLRSSALFSCFSSFLPSFGSASMLLTMGRQTIGISFLQTGNPAQTFGSRLNRIKIRWKKGSVRKVVNLLCSVRAFGRESARQYLSSKRRILRNEYGECAKRS